MFVMSTTTTPKWIFNKELADLKGKYITVVSNSNKVFITKPWQCLRIAAYLYNLIFTKSLNLSSKT